MPFLSRNKLTLFALLALFSLFFVITVWWAYVPSAAAVRSCSAPMDGYTCVNIGGFSLSVYSELSDNDDSETPVVLLHGGPGLSSASLLPHLKYLGDHARLITYDQRGSGYSESKADLGFYTMDLLVNELDQVRTDIAQTDKLTIVGHSAGAFLALAYAASYPDSVEKLVLFSPPRPGFELSAITHLLSLGIPPKDPNLVDDWFSSKQKQWLKLSFEDDRNLSKYSGERASYAAMMAIGADMWAIEDVEGLLRDVTTPTLILHGGEAELPNSTEKHQIWIASKIPNVVRKKVPESGHWVFIEKPESVRKDVTNFLSH